MMADAMFMIIQSSRLFLTAVTPTAVIPTAIILWTLVISNYFRQVYCKCWYLCICSFVNFPICVLLYLYTCVQGSRIFCPNPDVFQPANVRQSAHVRNLFKIWQKTAKTKKYTEHFKTSFDALYGLIKYCIELCLVLSSRQFVPSAGHIVQSPVSLSNLLWVVSNLPWVEISFCPTKYVLSKPTGSLRSHFLEPFLYACLLVYLCTCVLLHFCTCRLVFMCTCVVEVVYLFTCVLVYLRTCVLVSLCPCVLMYLCTCVVIVFVYNGCIVWFFSPQDQIWPDLNNNITRSKTVIQKVLSLPFFWQPGEACRWRVC